ncbi:MAG TPA: DNA primase [Polyangiaceae bacterium LLY-WYZ-15_(1-7)]|nr:DNA primase [Myxococcales bacterium]MAT29007.1 DNA primase [Sandaracinus sp.]HJK92251.1 DNA primase [Polyangiaceae bacterium LLY-WYZ-15_(1-7)]HJL04007.1 DNA primase [Polyangiaceae bacterium LLY-WYZ-15_(1-7)]HJL10545.1 DNA primase [Polyangiaceae bacterium LLY-WYZ-15_(1-7)]
MIPERTIADIRERIDIAAFVGEYVRLKKSGASFKGLCPFHNEKTPSFYVHPQRRFFHCFGCSASGDVFAFLMRLEGLAFPEAARLLAERAGVEIPADDPARDAAFKRERKRDERLAALVDAAAGFFIAQLDDHPLGQMARDAYHGRHIDDDTARTFRLGYAPHGWDGLIQFLKKGEWSPRDAEATGLIVPRKRGSGYYDRFRHRLMFPVADHQGRIVAFSGRALDPPPGEDEGREPGAKYINSPESPLYTKGKVLFGLFEGRVEIRRRGWALLCEGNFDLLALHQHGFANAVAPLGTALTEDQAKLLKRYAERAVLLFDGDAAGRKATRAAYDILAKVGLAAQVVTLPEGGDPDTFLREQGPEALQERIDNAPGIVEHLIDQAAIDGQRDAAAKAEAIAALGPVLAKVGSPVEARLHVERVARKFGIHDVEAVRRQLRAGVRSARRRRRGEPEPEAPRKLQRAGKKVDFDGLELRLLGLLLDCPDLFGTAEAKNFGELLTSPDLRAIFLGTSRLVEERGGVEAPALLEEVQGNPALPWLEGRLARPEQEDSRGALELLRKGLRQLGQRSRQARLRALSQQIQQARQRGDDAAADEMMKKYVALFRGARDEKGSRGDDGDESSRFEDHGA